MLDMSEIPTEAFEYIIELRKEAARYRGQRREARNELAAANVRIASLMLDNADLKAGIIPQSA